MAKSRILCRVVDGKAGAAILAISTLVALWFAVYGAFVFFSDSTTFFAYADRLRYFRTGSYYYTIGYPSIIAATGYPWTGSVVPLLGVQAAFAALTPWLAFKTFAPFNRRAGIAAGTVCLASLTPFFFENTFFHDGPCLFFGFLSITFASIFFGIKSPRYMYLSLASATFAYLLQPGVIGFVVGCAGAFAAFAHYDRRQLKHVAAAMGIFVASVAGFAAFQKWSMRQDGATVIPSQIGRRLFFDEYLQGSPDKKFAGPEAGELRHQLVDFFAGPWRRGYSEYIGAVLKRFGADYQDFIGQYDGHEAELVERIFAQPNRAYYEILQSVPDMPGGVADDVFLRAALAYLYHNPLAVAGFVWENLVGFTIGQPWSCTGHDIFPACRVSQKISFYPALSNQVVVTPAAIPDKAYHFLTSREVSQSVFMRAAVGAWHWIYYDLRLPLLVSMLFGWVISFWGQRELSWTLGAFVASYVANILLFSLFEAPEYRYQLVGIAMTAFAAGPGISFVLSWLARAAALVGFRRSRRA